MTERAEGAEPFPVTADPRNYVQTAATEYALAAIQRKMREGRAPVVLVGAPGVGKTLLLRVLEERLAASFQVVYLPFALLPADQLCAWVLGGLGESAGPDPERELLAASLRLERTGSSLVVMLDDAGSMPVVTARRFSALLAEAKGAIHLVLALVEGPDSEQMLSSFQPEVSRVELRALSSAEETSRYLRAHLVRSNAPRELRARFDPASIRDLHRGSGGVPRVLSGLAGQLVRGNLAALPRRERVVHSEPLQSGADPFAVTSDPAAYVPRRASQELLESVEKALRKGEQVIAVTGPAGLGKTLLLRVLERRLRGGSRPVRISYTALLPDELCRWILTLVGEPAAEDPEAALLELARRLGSSQTNLVLLLDDVGSIPVPTLRRLAEMAGETNGAMRLVLFSAEDARTAGMLAALGSDAVTLRFTEPMSADETAEYIYGRLAQARAPTALVEYFDPETVARLHSESEGIPRELHKLAGELYRQGAAAVAARASAPPERGARARSETQAPPTPPVPSRAGAEKPKRELPPERAPTSERAIVFGLLGIAILLAAIPFLRGGLPWMAAPRSVEPVVAPPAAVQPPGTPAPPTPEEAMEPIAVSIDATPWASIEVDGEYLGVTPLAGVPLSPGSHLFRARMPDGGIREHRVEVGPTMRHVVFYAEPAPEEPEPEPEKKAAPAAPPPVREESEEVAADAVPYLERELPEIAVAPERVASVLEPEPAAPPPAPEIAAPSTPPAAEETSESPAEPARPPPAETPESDIAFEQVTSARDAEIAALAPAPEPRIAAPSTPPSAEETSESAVEPSRPPQEETPEIAITPEQVASVREPEPVATPPAPEPRIAAPSTPPSAEETSESAVEPSRPPQEETPEIAITPEQVASVREPEPVATPPAPEPISVSINATPWADVEIDGDEVGVTPLAGVLLAPGDHQFRVLMPDGTVLERVVRISPDNRHIAFPQ